MDALTFLYGTAEQKELFDAVHESIRSAVSLGRTGTKLKPNQKSTLSFLCVLMLFLAHQSACSIALGSLVQAEELIKTLRSCLGYTKKALQAVY